MKMVTKAVVSLAIGALALAGCGGSTPTAPSAHSVKITWNSTKCVSASVISQVVGHRVVAARSQGSTDTLGNLTCGWRDDPTGFHYWVAVSTVSKSSIHRGHLPP